jgi:hypothetical protein
MGWESKISTPKHPPLQKRIRKLLRQEDTDGMHWKVDESISHGSNHKVLENARFGNEQRLGIAWLDIARKKVEREFKYLTWSAQARILRAEMLLAFTASRLTNERKTSDDNGQSSKKAGCPEQLGSQDNTCNEAVEERHGAEDHGQCCGMRAPPHCSGERGLSVTHKKNGVFFFKE